jgi:sulfonate transport system ATP-binding protein
MSAAGGPSPGHAHLEYGQQAGADVVVRNLAVDYGERRVLEALDLTLAAGEFLAVVGRSGCGKSTLLRVLAGLLAPGQGSVTIDGRSAAHWAQASDNPVRLMFQEARLLPWQRVLANVALGLPGRDAGAQARAALEQVALADRADDWPANLSGGQRQRVALARALVHTPRLLLLDEPLGALDALTRREMQALVGRLCAERGLTAVLVTHDIHEAVTLADRVVLLERGTVAEWFEVDLPRPRHPELPGLAQLEHRMVRRVLGENAI